VLTHAAGLSSTGVAELDADLPLPERYEIPARTVGAIEAARSRGGRVIAVGTSVVRALEGAARHNGGRLSPGAGVTDLIITPAFVPQVVDGLISGIHEPSESHYQLLGAFVPRPLLEAGLRLATERGYQTHEFGDTCLIA
jgi:S-adenosylmethionine:tRNA ribosyltransferase-isomerase